MGAKTLIAGLMLFYGSLFGVQAQDKPEEHKIAVVDEKKEPLYGVNVLVDDTLGTITNMQGVATFNNLPDKNHNMVLSYVGYEKIETKIDSGKYNYYFSLKPKVIEGETVTVIGSKTLEMLKPSAPEENVSKRIIENTNSVMGNSQTEQVFLSTPGFSVIPGNFNFATADETDFQVKVNGIPVQMNAFLDYDAPWYGDFMDYTLYTTGLSPENPRGQFGLLEFNTNYKYGDRFRGTAHIDVIRGQASTIFPKDKSIINASYEHNLLSNWGFAKEFNPKKSQFLGGIKSNYENSSLNLNILLSLSTIDLANRPFRPSQEIWQTAGSAFWQKINKENIIDISAVINKKSEIIKYGEKGLISNSRLGTELGIKNTVQHETGMLRYGVETHLNYDKLKFDLDGAEQISVLNEAAFSDEENSVSQIYIPTYLFLVNNNRINENIELEYGAVSLFDPKYIKKGITFGPYVGASYFNKEENWHLKVVFTERYTDQDYQILSDGIIPLNYSDLKYPKSDQIAVMFKHGNFGHRLLYAKFRDQYRKEIRLNPELDWIMNQYAFYNLSNMSPEELVLIFPSLANDPESLQNMINLIQDLPNEESEVRQYYEKYGNEYINNRNRDVLSYTGWYTNKDNFLLSATFTKSNEGGLFNGSTPYKDEVALSLKAFYTDILIGDNNNNLSFSTSFAFNSGKRYTDKYPDMSFAEENEINKSEIQMLSEYFGEDITKYITQERAIQGPRNRGILPPTYDFNVGLSYNFSQMFGKIDGSIGLFASNPQFFFKGVDKNVQDVYFTYDEGKLVKKYGNGAGGLGGLFISIRY